MGADSPLPSVGVVPRCEEKWLCEGDGGPRGTSQLWERRLVVGSEWLPSGSRGLCPSRRWLGGGACTAAVLSGRPPSGRLLNELAR